MALFHFIGLDRKGALATRMAVRPEHLAYANDYVVLGGPILDEHGDPMGSVMIVKADNIEAAKSKLDHDPYTKADLFESTWLRPWRAAIGGIAGYEG